MPERIDLRSERDLSAAVGKTLAFLRAGKIVVFPTETVYGLGALASRPETVERLYAMKARDRNKPLAIAISGMELLDELLPDLTESQKRLPRRCWPGPVTIVLPGTGPMSFVHTLDETVRRALLGDDAVAFRVPNHPFTLAVLEQLCEPLLLSSANRSGGEEIGDPEKIRETFGDRIDLMIEDGPAKHSQPSTVVRVETAHKTGKNAGEISILRRGSVPESAIERLSGTIVLFVCTGNTCRSPMAEVICRKLLAERLGCDPEELEHRGYVVMSAGIAAGDQSPASEPAKRYAFSQGLSLEDHLSQPLSETHVRFADRIYAMTRSHRQAILSYWPQVDTRLSVLSRDGSDIADPYGGGEGVYFLCGEQLRREIAERIDEILAL